MVESINILLNYGFDYQTRAIIRNIQELCLLSICLINDKNMLKSYLDGKSSSQFRPSQLRKKVSEIVRNCLYLKMN